LGHPSLTISGQVREPGSWIVPEAQGLVVPAGTEVFRRGVGVDLWRSRAIGSELVDLGALRRGHCSTHVGFAVGDQLVRESLQLIPPRRPGFSERLRDADDLGDAVLVDVGPGDVATSRQFCSKRRLVQHAGGLLMTEQLPPVDRQPFAICRAHFVRNQQVRVELRIGGSRGAVHERRAEEALGVDLEDTGVTASREGGVLVQERECHLDGGVMRGEHFCGDCCIRTGPEHAHRLRRREAHREPCDDACLVRRETAAKRFAGSRIGPAAEEPLERERRNVCFSETECDSPSSDEAAEGLGGDGVIVLPPGRDFLGVVAPAARRHLRKRHHEWENPRRGGGISGAEVSNTTAVMTERERPV
jgi:hypothetical protein